MRLDRSAITHASLTTTAQNGNQSRTMQLQLLIEQEYVHSHI